MGTHSLKLHPATGWYPNDKMVYPIYKKCAEAGIRVNFHTGPFYYPLKSKYCHPMYLDNVAVDFPELTVHCTHAVDLLFMDIVALARVRKNMVLDLGVWQVWLRGSRSTAISFYKNVRFMMDIVGPRLIFGSDWSALVDDTPYHEWIKAFTEIPVWVKEAGIEFSQDEIDGFLGNNSVKLLHLDSK
ncbi:amidohydrolase family protein [Thermodesulfobacteriota bacterium]